MSPTTPNSLRSKLHEIVFGTYTLPGKAFDLVLIISIIGSVVAVMLASIPSIREHHSQALRFTEWAFTILFTFEYLLRIWISDSRKKYITSFFGIIDFLAILPTYVSLFYPGAEFLIVVRGIRVLRVFRILKLLAYMEGASVLRRALWMSRHKITVFFFTVLILVVIVGSLMYLIEGAEAGFTSIPISVYWAVVTLTTVGYGDISPITPVGQFLAMIVMLLGYAIIAVPTGIVTAEISQAEYSRTQICSRCKTRSRPNARFCDQCGDSF